MKRNKLVATIIILTTLLPCLSHGNAVTTGGYSALEKAYALKVEKASRMEDLVSRKLQVLKIQTAILDKKVEDVEDTDLFDPSRRPSKLAERFRDWQVSSAPKEKLADIDADIDKSLHQVTFAMELIKSVPPGEYDDFAAILRTISNEMVTSTLKDALLNFNSLTAQFNNEAAKINRPTPEQSSVSTTNLGNRKLP